MSEIMKRHPQPVESSAQDLRDPAVDRRERSIAAENQRMYGRLVEISSRKLVDKWPNH